ncbi:30S ribosomal protein S16 [Candidatus Woesebacteria bacterium RBG_19FT_COMBO_47_8]|uniref:Small ribosomal subunit protein bS16 n=1 Tax=Candidatus Woesebacteria bacterium RBG_13_46_13 TaxID=1802479 RepID=A0A1F7X5G0_9BACT|nr:MAG: 30S ribosomal protein S16 [Candidatus Woesebacteria bacterium RBG_13_46_13]OGM17622.1 MAG: 30S ribosomal protein S16 [Candidatus Woesebacteria bacterium RBG_19FT_COMBO_47_8]HJX59569.1 30S ribosomal protein S16 [Patescibacteria group bacterium]
MVKIRLYRLGVRKKAFYRIVAIEDSQKASGVALEIIGYWHPSKDALEIDKEKLDKWLKKGAQVTKAVKELIDKKAK